jgi:DNA-directed RNA polymerase beta subunit/intein/homing endonuclease
MSRNNKMTTLFSSSLNETSYDIKNEQYIEDPWTIIGSYFKSHHLDRLVRHQLESYNNFVGYQINKTIEMFNPVTIASDNDYDPVSKKHSLEIVVNFVNFQIYRPQIHENNGATKLMFPQEARLRNFTYASAMTIDLNIKYIIRTGADLDSVQILHKAITKIHIGKLPIMLKSNICVLNQYKHVENTQLGECKYDAGGYFIINGSEKTVIGQERAAENRVYCYNVSKNNTKYNWIAEMKSVPDFKCISPKQINVMVSSKNNGFGYAVYVQIPRIKQDIPLFIVFRAIGVITDKEICEKILLDINVPEYKEICDNLQASIIEANGYLTQEECIKYITSYAMFTPINMDRETGAKKKMDFTMDVLNNDLFPHCHNNNQKIYFLGYMTFRILLANFNMAKVDDRDSYLNKRVDLTGTLLNNLFRNYFNKLVKDMEKQVIREINNGSWKSRDDYESIINMTNIYKIFKSTTIENGLKRALATGDFGVKHTTNSNKVGVAQVLNRLTYVSSLSHARRISTPTDKSGKLIPPRKLHNTSWGYLCLTGDVDVLLSNRMDTKKIKDIRNGDWVNTVNRKNLLDEPSDMYQYFSKMPDKLYEITTISGRKIKATADHPFLVKVGDVSGATKYEMKKVCDLSLDDKVIIRHMPMYIPDENTTVVIIRSEDVLDHYRMDLLESNLLNVRIPTFKLKIIARLIGFGVNIEMYDKYYRTSFSIGDKYDACQIADDIKELGFGSPFITRSLSVFENDNQNTWQINKDGTFAYFMSLMGATQHAKKEVPTWLLYAEPSIKREFLSGFQSGKDIENEEFTSQIIDMFKEFNIQFHLNGEKFTFENSIDNLIRHDDVIHYAYCEEMRIKLAPAIEYMKIIKFMKKNKYGDYISFIEETLVDNGCVSVPILSILEIEPELVYDFTTRSENHSFVASSYVLSNCVAETPEGASVGIVKNMSYMTHITIHSNSLPLYEYVLPFIRKIEEIKSSYELYDKVKVFINGAWLGISEQPYELFLSLKEKKYKGIINIYTSIVFNYSLKEIRVCNDGGRVTRPVLRVKDKNILITRNILEQLKEGELIWDNLLTSSVLDNSVIEYIDPEEQAWSMIATFPKEIISDKGTNIMKYTHCEIHPSTIFGILASCIPFPEHNQSPRNTYQCLDINETVLMSDGSKKRIAEIAIGDEVVSFHPETMETSITKVTHHYVRETCKKIYKITTISGREIIATEDHKFMTTDGWMEVQQMIPGDTKIGVYIGEKSVLFQSKMNEYIKYKSIHTEFIEFEKWCNLYLECLTNTLFIKIQSIEEVENRLISDITVESENHSFIAGDNFLSSNCAQGKQAMGVYVTNYENRMDKTAYVLNYPARPLVDTRLMNLIHLNKIPSGTNVIVAIMTHTGYNQEDSLIFNKGSIDRGLFVTTIYHTEKDEDKQKINGDEEIRCNPDKSKTKGMKMGNYSKVNNKGVVPENTLVENRDIIIAKVVPIKENRNDNTKVIKFEDQSKIYKTTEETFIDKNYIDRNGEGYNFAKVRLRTFRKPVIGDKFSSRHGKTYLTTCIIMY